LLNTTGASVLFLGFQYFELQNIHKQIPNYIRIPIFSREFVHKKWSGPCTMNLFSPSIQQRKQVYNFEANDVGVVYNKLRTNRLYVYNKSFTW